MHVWFDVASSSWDIWLAMVDEGQCVRRLSDKGRRCSRSFSNTPLLSHVKWFWGMCWLQNGGALFHRGRAFIFDIKLDRSYTTVMLGWVFFSWVISQVCSPFFPVVIVVSAEHTVAEPVVFFVKRFWLFLFHRALDDADGRAVVGNDGCWWLMVAKIDECSSDWNGSVSYTHLTLPTNDLV